MKKRKTEISRIKNVHARDIAIQERFVSLYHGQRLRYDDVIRTLATTFFVSEHTIHKSLRRTKPK